MLSVIHVKTNCTTRELDDTFQHNLATLQCIGLKSTGGGTVCSYTAMTAGNTVATSAFEVTESV